MNKQQRIVVWVVASVLSVVSIVNGLIGAHRGEYPVNPYYVWRPDSIFWFVILPVILLGIAAFLHFIRPKK